MTLPKSCDFNCAHKKAASLGREFHPGLAALFEEPTYLDCVNVLVLERFQYQLPILLLGGASPGNSTLASDLLKPALSIFISGKAAFIQPECRRVVITAAVDHPCRMFNMKHLVIENGFHEPFRHLS
jgi:hypothetical protein